MFRLVTSHMVRMIIPHSVATDRSGDDGVLMFQGSNRRTFVLSVLAGAIAPAQAHDRLDRRNLLLYRDTRGSIQPVRTVPQWLRRRAEIVRGMQDVMGPLPGPEKRCPLDVRIVEETDAGGYVRRLISYAAEPDGRVPAYLLIPKSLLNSRKTAPAILCLHPTDDKVGHKVVVGLGGLANRQYAAELAERGYVTLAPSYPLLATYQPELERLGYQSGTMKAIWDNIRGLDVLEQLPFVRKGVFGAIGHSLGGHNSVYTAVFESRIRAVVSSCGLDSYLDYKDGDIRGWTSRRYMPKLLQYQDRLEEIPFDFHEMVGALAPRACFISAPLKDDNFKWRSVDHVAEAARQVYQLYGKGTNLIVEHPDCEHDFPDSMRELAYRIFEQHLR
jgi:dienelactone hydrolase